jgi:hypothetical protein
MTTQWLLQVVVAYGALLAAIVLYGQILRRTDDTSPEWKGKVSWFQRFSILMTTLVMAAGVMYHLEEAWRGPALVVALCAALAEVAGLMVLRRGLARRHPS